uniref:Rapamycin-insensitive companion of mTOR N-terminal domain-containing protein n=1 Tax=Amphimedon queenslandica TaxID=400682 RepID=A0A1X7SFK9_AMPQE
GVLAPITDLHFSFHTNDNTTTDIKSDRDKRVESAKISITALLKSWPGFLLLLNPSINGISTIINMLPLTEPYIQVTLIN